MTTKLILLDRKGVRHAAQFDVKSGSLCWADTGRHIALDQVQLSYVTPSTPWEHDAEQVISPTNPGRKDGEKSVVKIQLGLACNFSCDYCCQGDQDAPAIHSPSGKRVIPLVAKTAARSDDVTRFLDNLPNWLTPANSLRFELWGGEPFIYWKTFRPLAEGLMRQHPQATVFTITNGSLLTDEIVDWYLQHPALSIAVSHDGPGGYRDKDVLDNPAVSRLFHGLRAQGRTMGFNCVLTAGNLSVVAIRQYIAHKLGVPADDVQLSTEGIITPHDEASKRFVPTHDEMGIVFRELVSKKSLFMFYKDLFDFVQGVAAGQASTAIGQKCGLDRPDVIAVSLKSQDVVTCQNTLPIGKHRIGHVDDLAGVELNTSWHWKTRPKCSACPVLSLCRGSCMYMEGAAFEHACESQFKYRLPFLAAALYFVTGFVLARVEWAGGDVDLDYLGEAIPKEVCNVAR